MAKKMLLVVAVLFLFFVSTHAQNNTVIVAPDPKPSPGKCPVSATADVGFHGSYLDEDLGARYYSKPTFTTGFDVNCTRGKYTIGVYLWTSTQANGRIGDGSEFQVDPYLGVQFDEKNNLTLTAGDWRVPNLHVTNERLDYGHVFTDRKVKVSYIGTVGAIQTNDRSVPGGWFTVHSIEVEKEFKTFSLKLKQGISLDNNIYGYGPKNQVVGINHTGLTIQKKLNNRFTIFVGFDSSVPIFGKTERGFYVSPVLGLNIKIK